jgi:2-dehydropantoate 2-reductase
MRHESYWWHCRKADRSSGNWIELEQRKDLWRRHYNEQAAERRSISTPEEIPFVERFSRQSQANNRMPAPMPNRISSPPPAQIQDQGLPGGENIEDLEQNTDGGTIQTGAQLSPTSDERLEAISENYSCETENRVESVEIPEDNINGLRLNINYSDSSQGTAVGSNATSSNDLRGHTQQFADEKKSALQSIAPSQEAKPRKEERRNWVPLAEREGANADLQHTTALNEHVDLNLETEIQPRTIHILGTGPTGKYIAHALAGTPKAPSVTLLMHKPLLMQQWHEEGANIRLFKNGKIDTKSNFIIESSARTKRESPTQRFPGFGKNLEHTAEPPTTVIETLIVTTKGHTTVAALSAIKQRLLHSSTICFIQDGMGIMNLVDRMVFPDPASRPNYMLGNMSHELISTQKKFTLVEKRPGKIFVTIVPRKSRIQGLRRDPQEATPLIRRMDACWTPMSMWLLRTLSRTPELGAVGLAQSDFYENQLQKLAINSVIGPLSVMYDCFNNELLCNYHASRSMKLLLKEISTILQRLPEVSRAAKIDKRFGALALERITVGVLEKTGRNSSAMLQAVRKGEKTDVDFYNGYLVRRAAELGIDCPHLEMMVAMVKGKQAMKSRERNSIPFVTR